MSNDERQVRILYASQGGTAQLFAQQLAEGLEDLNESTHSGNKFKFDVSIKGWHQFPDKTPSKLLQPGEAWHVFLTSVAGVGDPPDNGRQFYEWLKSTEEVCLKDLKYTVFGLGNSKAHPKHYNVIGIDVDLRLHKLGARRVFPLGLGDDSDCIENDFDIWMDGLLKCITEASDESEEHEQKQNKALAKEELSRPTSSIVDTKQSHTAISDTKAIPEQQRINCLPGIGSDEDGGGTRLLSIRYPPLDLRQPQKTTVCHDLFDTPGFYRDSAVKAKVVHSRSLSAYGGESGLREIVLTHPDLEYETGDHLIVYPRNSDAVVDAYLNLLDVSPHTIVEGTTESSHPYPHPTGLSVHETLSHCVDLGAQPSPAVCRYILGRQNIDYKKEISDARRTLLDLVLEGGERKIALEDLLYSLTPMKGRYYSISSSSLAAIPNEVRLTYRPVKYVTPRGYLREGVCTSYLSTMAGMENRKKYQEEQFLSVAVNSNPAFRLPTDASTPILLIAGGCGVAPIRAFAEERLALRRQGIRLGPGHVYLGFRSQEDEVYRDLMEEAVQEEALTAFKVSYSNSSSTQPCLDVNELIRKESGWIWNHLETGGTTYVCGGARSFGAAIYQELLDVICEHKPTNLEGAEVYLRKLLEDGKLLEDLAD